MNITNPVLTGTLANILNTAENPGVVFLNLLLKNAIILIFILSAIVFFFMFMIGGFQWMTSAGDTKKVEEARGKIMTALIGLVIVFSVYAILRVIGYIFDFDLVNLNINRLIIQ